LEKILRNLEYLKKLEVTWSELYYPASSLKHAEVSFHFGRNFFPSLDNHQSWIEDYVASGYKPQYINITYSNSPKWPIVSIKPLPILKCWSNYSPTRPVQATRWIHCSF